MNKHQTQHAKDKVSYAKFIKEHGKEPGFIGTNEKEKASFKKARDKWLKQYTQWSKS